MKKYKIFVINPGSTSTKLALFENEHKILETNVFHDSSVLLQFPTVNAQLPYRKKLIMDFLSENHIDLSDVDAIVGRGGSCYPVASGVYVIDDKLIEDTAAGKGGILASWYGVYACPAKDGTGEFTSSNPYGSEAAVPASTTVVPLKASGVLEQCDIAAHLRRRLVPLWITVAAFSALLAAFVRL